MPPAGWTSRASRPCHSSQTWVAAEKTQEIQGLTLTLAVAMPRLAMQPRQRPCPL